MKKILITFLTIGLIINIMGCGKNTNKKETAKTGKESEILLDNKENTSDENKDKTKKSEDEETKVDSKDTESKNDLTSKSSNTENIQSNSSNGNNNTGNGGSSGKEESNNTPANNGENKPINEGEVAKAVTKEKAKEIILALEEFKQGKYDFKYIDNTKGENDKYHMYNIDFLADDGSLIEHIFFIYCVNKENGDVAVVLPVDGEDYKFISYKDFKDGNF